jgi:hypothetical protein
MALKVIVLKFSIHDDAQDIENKINEIVSSYQNHDIKVNTCCGQWNIVYTIMIEDIQIVHGESLTASSLIDTLNKTDVRSNP